MRALALSVLVGAAPVAAQEAVGRPTTYVETFFEIEPRVGRAITDAQGRRVNIEWRAPVEVRARTITGALLTEGEQAAVRAQVVSCGRGAPVDLRDHVERSGTYVVRYDCFFLQEPR